MGGHQPRCKEVAPQPVVLSPILKNVSEFSVGENVEKEFPSRFEPGGYAGQKLLPVAHVFKHLNRYDAMEGLISVEIIHISTYHFYIIELQCCAPRLDKLPLRPGIGHRYYSAVRVLLCHPPRKRA